MLDEVTYSLGFQDNTQYLDNLSIYGTEFWLHYDRINPPPELSVSTESLAAELEQKGGAWNSRLD